MDKEKKENVVKMEDDRYYSGAFWVIADSIKDIFKGKFEIVGEKILVDYVGNKIEQAQKRDEPHKKLWKNDEFSKWNRDFKYNYFPRGRLCIYDGELYL